MRGVYLDDERNPKTDRNWTIVRNYDEFVKEVETNGIPDFMSLDHDLGEERSGKDCLAWFINHCQDKGVPLKTVEFNIHSANPIGAANMWSLWQCVLKFEG